MSYYRKMEVNTPELKGTLHVTDSLDEAKQLRAAGEAVLIYFHDENRNEDFSDFMFGVEEPAHLEDEYVERVYRRLKGLPWNILKTQRCLIRETTPEDVEDFFRIYSDPAFTKSGGTGIYHRCSLAEKGVRGRGVPGDSGLWHGSAGLPGGECSGGDRKRSVVKVMR